MWSTKHCLTSTGNPFAILTQSFIRYSVHVQDEVIFKDDVSHNGEEVDQDESQHSGQNDGAAVPGDALDDVQQRLLSVDQVKELRRVKWDCVCIYTIHVGESVRGEKAVKSDTHVWMMVCCGCVLYSQAGCRRRREQKLQGCIWWDRADDTGTPHPISSPYSLLWMYHDFLRNSSGISLYCTPKNRRNTAHVNHTKRWRLDLN